MLATLRPAPFSSPDWLFELKWDGMRVVTFIRDGAIELRSRTQQVVTSHFPELAHINRSVKSRDAILDGEVVTFNAGGRPDFQLLQQRMNVASPPTMLVKNVPVVYIVFDILYAAGRDLRKLPLTERKQILNDEIKPSNLVRLSQTVEGQGEQLYKFASEQQMEGVIGKRAQSPYVEKRSSDWVKFKTNLELEAVICGFTEPRGSRQHFGSLLLGLYDHAGKLTFVGGVGTGFTQGLLASLMTQLRPLITAKCPITPTPHTRENATWVQPKLVARVRYSERTSEGLLRQPAFLGLRKDIKPESCTTAQLTLAS